MKFADQDTRRLFELMQWRRDVRHFKPDALSDVEIENLKKAMALAPSVGNSRPWRVVVVESLPLREKVIENFKAANEKAAQKYTGEKYQRYLGLKLAGLHEAPLHLAIFTDPDPIAGHGLGRQTMPETLNYSTVSAIHQLWLAARSMNIGVGWVSILDDNALNDILHVDPGWQLTAYLCIGYPEEMSDEPELQKVGWQMNEEPEWTFR